MYKREILSACGTYLLFSTHDFQVFLSFLHSIYTESSFLEVYLDSLQIPVFIFSIELVLNEKKWLELFFALSPSGFLC